MKSSNSKCDHTSVAYVCMLEGIVGVMNCSSFDSILCGQRCGWPGMSLSSASTWMLEVYQR